MPDPLRCVRQTPFRSFTLSRLIAASGEYLWLKRVPPFVIHPFVGGAINCCAVKAGAGVIATGAPGAIVGDGAVAASARPCDSAAISSSSAGVSSLADVSV